MSGMTNTATQINRKVAEMGRLEKDEKAPIGQGEGASQGHLHHRPQDEGKDHRSRFILKFFQEKAEETKRPGNDDVDDVVIQAISADQAEENDKREKVRVRNPEKPHPDGNQREVQNQEQDIPDIHARNHPPEEVGSVLDQKGARG